MTNKEAQQEISALNQLLLDKQDHINAISAERDALRAALEFLWKVKQWKDNHGKDDFYMQKQPVAWQLAKEALETCPKQPKETISAPLPAGVVQGIN